MQPRRDRGQPGENTEHYVFAYGSLVSPDSVELTLGRRIDRAKCGPAWLNGWRREWNVGSDQSSHPERTFLGPDGIRFDGVTVVLGIAEVTGADRVQGAVFGVDVDDFVRLDKRERNYRRIAVTEAVSWSAKPGNVVVHTYLPRARAVQRLTHACRAGHDICIRRDYLDLVEAAFRRVGQLATFRASAPRPFATRDLTAVFYDPAPQWCLNAHRH